MSVVEQVNETQASEQSKQVSADPSRMAAAVEAAYILEAVRK